jgi:hypothetical protein
MGRLGDVADILTAGLVLGGGYLAYRAWKGLPSFTWPSLPTWGDLEIPAAGGILDRDVTLTAGEDIPLITFTPSVPDLTPRFEAEISTRRALADIMERQERGLVKASGLTRAEITQSERLAFESARLGVTDY